MDFAILDKDHNPVPATIEEMSVWQQRDRDWRVDETHIGPFRISTVFLGIDHAFGRGEPLWFETMIFGGNDDGSTADYQDRYTTWAQAVAGHRKACGLLETARRKLTWWQRVLWYLGQGKKEGESPEQ